MKKESDVPEMLIIVGVLIVASYPIILNAKDYLSQKFNSVSYQFNGFLSYINTHGITAFVLGLIVVLSLYAIYRIIKSIIIRIRTKKEETKQLKQEIKEIKKILNKKLEFDYKDILAFIEQLESKIKLINENKKLSLYDEELKDKLEKARSFLECIEYEQYINSLNLKGEELDNKVKELEEKKAQLEQDLSKPEEIREQKPIEETPKPIRQHNNEGFIDAHKGFFKYSTLSLDDVKYLKKRGYQEYCFTSITSDKKELYLIKPRPNESPQHFFLICDIAEYLKKFTNKIQTFNSVKPDIVFEMNFQDYAIEVETGSMLKSNKKELFDKIKSLNQNYGKNWFFVVTNKNLQPKYSKFGETHTKHTIINKLFRVSKNAPSV